MTVQQSTPHHGGGNPAPPLRSVHTVAPIGDQADAVDRVVRWFYDPIAPQVFRFFGYAGTGKTTLAQYIVARLGLTRVHYVAFSGKAADVLRRKGCAGAQTIHSLIYRPDGNDQAALDRLQDMLDDLDDPDGPLGDRLREIIAEGITTDPDNPRFVRRDASELVGADLLVVDEVSMVNGDVMDDLKSFGVKILCLGDPAQLPPVTGDATVIDGEPDVQLTTIHRSASDSPVTRIATAVRCAEEWDWTLGVNGEDDGSGRWTHTTIARACEMDQVLVWSNRLRWDLVKAMRRHLGRTGDMPEPGDKIMTLVNSDTAQVLNGQQFVVESVHETAHTGKLDLHVIGEDGTRQKLTVWKDGFLGLDGERTAKRHGRSSTAVATFSHAITVHKSQGSQWDRVLVVDDTRGIRGMTYHQHLERSGKAVARAEGHLAARRWLYTAITRAAVQVAIVKDVRP